MLTKPTKLSEDERKAFLDKLVSLREKLINCKLDIHDVSTVLIESEMGYQNGERVLLNGKAGFVDYVIPEEGRETTDLRIKFPGKTAVSRAMYRYVHPDDKVERV